MKEKFYEEIVYLCKETLDTSNLDAIKFFKLIHKYENDIKSLSKIKD